MSTPPILHGVCIKVTPEVDRFLRNLDPCRNYLIQHKIIASQKVLTPGEQYDIHVPLSKDHHVVFACVGVLTPHPEIMVLSYEEIHARRKLPLRRIAAGMVTTTLISMELMYYGGHNLQGLAAAVSALRQSLGW